MIQHFMTDGRNTESICGTDMVGQRNPAVDTDDGATTCINCVAILAGKPLYQITAVDEDGYTDRQRFNTPAEQMAAIEEALDNGAVNITLQILSVDELKSGE